MSPEDVYSPNTVQVKRSEFELCGATLVNHTADHSTLQIREDLAHRENCSH